MPRPTLDLESYSEAGHCWQEPTEKYPLGRWVPPQGAKTMGIAAVGSAAYAEHPTTEVLCASYDLADGLGVRRWLPGQPMPLDLRIHVESGGTLEFHKADFEVGMWAAQLVVKHGWIPLPVEATRCSMAKAHVAQYPGALGNLGAVLGIETEKDKDGKRLINKFCVPQQPVPGLVDKRTGKVKREPVPARRIYPHDDPEDFERLCSYCDTDVIAQMHASDAMPDMEPHEVVAWQLDQEMNHRGLAVDLDGMFACIEILDQVLDQYGAECERITGFAATQLEKLKGWLAAYGVHTTSLDADAVTALLARDDLPQAPRRVLELRALTGSASVKKLYQMANQVSADGRLRHLVIHHGTRPGRPTGTGPQPLNLPKAGPQLVWCECGRPHKPAAAICPWCGEIGPPGRKAAWKPAMVDHVLEIMACGSLAMVEQFFGDAMLAISGCLRGLFIEDDEHELVSTDYSSLQAVVAACVSGEQWKIEAFRERKPVYLLSASSITGTSVETYETYAAEHGTHHPDRQAGKTAELALGFQGWTGAWLAMEEQQGVQSGYDEQRLKEIILAWRKANPAIVEMWGGQWRGPPWRRERHELYGMEGMFIAAVQNPGAAYTYRGVTFCMEDGLDTLVIRLPQIDGIRRPLRYHQPRLTTSDRNRDELSISYMTENSNAKYGGTGWTRMGTWGGRLFENVVMGVEVDIQRYGIKLLKQHGYDMVLGVYDEDCTRIRKGKPLVLGLAPVDGLDPYVQEVEHLLAQLPPEIADWPIRAADGWRGRRYRK